MAQILLKEVCPFDLLGGGRGCSLVALNELGGVFKRYHGGAVCPVPFTVH